MSQKTDDQCMKHESKRHTSGSRVGLEEMVYSVTMGGWGLAKYL